MGPSITLGCTGSQTGVRSDLHLLTAWWESTHSPLGSQTTACLPTAPHPQLASGIQAGLGSSQPAFPPLWSQTAAVANPTCGTCKVASCRLWAVELELPCNYDLVPPWEAPVLFCGLPQLYHTSPLRLSSWQSLPVLSLDSDLQSLSLSAQPLPALEGMQTSISGWAAKARLSFHPCVEFSQYCLIHTCCCTLLWDSKVPPPPPMRGFPGVWKLSLLHSSLPEVWVPSQILCISLFFLIAFALLPYVEISLLFWKVFFHCSIGIL